MKPSHGRLLLAAGLGAVLAGCASTGPIESRPSPRLPPFVEPAPVESRPTPDPPRPLPPIPSPQVSPAPKPPLTSYPGEAEGRGRIAGFIPPQIRDRDGWAADIFAALAALKIAPTPDNVCAVVAVIEQESSFQADPVVPGLPAIVWKEIDSRRHKLHLPQLLVDAAFSKTSPDGRSYRARVDSLRTEKEMNALFEDMISELPMGRSLLGGYNPVRTGGPMQVSVAFAEEQIRRKPYPYPRTGSVRDEVFTRRGGIYFGTAILLDFPAPYSRMIYRFADFNAGPFASRNAAFQAALGRVAGTGLTLDGDLLRYENGRPSDTPSATLSTLLGLAPRLGLSRGEILRDIRLEKTAAFGATALYQKVFALADGSGRQARELLPQIDLKSPKIQRKLTTAWFAERVDGRHRVCLGRDRSGLP